jgi:hypothetical protein
MMAHYYGDARFEGTEMLPSRGLSLMGDLVVASYHDFVRGLWKEKAPRKVELMEDNDFILLSDGAWSRIVN